MNLNVWGQASSIELLWVTRFQQFLRWHISIFLSSPLFFVGSKREIVEPICFFSYTVSIVPCLECQAWHWWKKTVLLSIESNGSKNWLMIIRGASEMHTTNKSETCFKKKTRVAIIESYLYHIWITFESCLNYIWTILESYLNHTWIVSES